MKLRMGPWSACGKSVALWSEVFALTEFDPNKYAVSMSKRITVVLDDAVAEGIALLDGRSASARVNEALRKAIDREQRRLVGLEWIQAMNAELGSPSAKDYEDADRLLDELGVPRIETKEAAA